MESGTKSSFAEIMGLTLNDCDKPPLRGPQSEYLRLCRRIVIPQKGAEYETMKPNIKALEKDSCASSEGWRIQWEGRPTGVIVRAP